MNVLNKYANWTTELIKADVQLNTLPYACMMSHVEGDFNISTAIRNANAFGCEKFFYFGKKAWDRRGSVGTHHYTNVVHLKSIEDIKELKKEYRLVAIECNIDRPCINVADYQIKPGSLFIFGEETKGLDNDILDLCDDFVFIGMRGSVRSLNVGTASGILMHNAMNALLPTN